jgi:oxygen-independent coproporphyrinogen-3 oxidase
MIGAGVASFSHVGGTHYQNEHQYETYIDRLTRGELPLLRALTPTDTERFVREFILKLKLGQLRRDYFTTKYATDPAVHFAAELKSLESEGFLQVHPETIELSRAGLLQVDRLLHQFFLPEHRNARYA